MSLSSEFRPIRPRSGTHYGIFVSAFAALVLLLLILEQLGARKLWLSHLIIVVPVAFYLGVAAATRTVDAHEFLSAGRRVPPIFGGLALAVTSFGGVGLFALTGALYLIGFDALSIAIGWGAGLLVAGILLVPYLRKSGAYTVPGFLRLRFRDPLLGGVASLLLLPPAALLLAAELRLGAFVASLFGAVPFATAVAAGAVTITLIAGLGGLRSLTWTQCTQYAVALAGFMVPLVVISVMVTNLPVPQLAYGVLFEPLAAQEAAIGIAIGNPLPLAQALPGEDPQASLAAFTQAFDTIGRADFTMLMLVVLAGTAAMPALLMRAGSSTDVFGSRQTVAWGLLFLALFLVTAPAYAAFAKFLVLRDLLGAAPSRVPEWIAALREAGLADLAVREADGVPVAADFIVARDGLTLALPIVGELPFILAALVGAAGIAAALAAATAHAAAIGNSLAEDMLSGLLRPGVSAGKRLLAARLGMITATALAAVCVAQIDFDVLQAAIWAMSLAASAFLPVLVLSIWWRRATALGSMAGMLAGFAASAAHILLASASGDGALFGLSGLLAGIVGMPIGTAVLVGVSLAIPTVLEPVEGLLDDIRDPSGATMLDRRPAARGRAE